MRKRLLAFFLALAMVLGTMPAAAFPVHAAEATPPFTSITTEDGASVTYTYKGAITVESAMGTTYENCPYYHVTVPAGTANVQVTYPEDVAILGDGSIAYSYSLTVPDYELGYDGGNYAVTVADDGSNIVTIPVADYLVTDGTGKATSLEAVDTFDPITFFSFEYAQSGTEQPEESEEPHTCTFDQKVVSGDFLAAAADCTHAATYYYSCTCGQKGTETFTDGEALNHDFQDGSCTRCSEPDPDATVDVTFTVNVEDYTITVTDADGEAVEAVGGVYKLLPGKTYTYTVQKDGYVTKTDTVKLQEAGTVEVTMEETPTPAGLSALGLYSTYSSATKDIYPMTPAFDPAVKEYTVVAPDSANMCYAKATLAEGITGTITAAWTNLNTDEAKTATITSGKSNGQTLAGAVKTGSYKNTVTITVAGADFEDVYTLNILRSPSLTGLALEGMKLSPTFTSATTAYTASTAQDSVTVAATPRDERYTVTVNGGADTTVALEMGENIIDVVVKNAEGYEMAYTITVTRKAAVAVSFQTNVENPNIVLKDANKTQVAPVDGVYTLISGETYSYTIQKDGYVGKTGEITPTQNSTVEITLDEATQNPNLPSYSAQWGNFRKGDNNLGITDAPTPYAPEDAELLWAVKDGTGWAAAPGSPIMVDGDIFTYIGTSIKRLDSMTGQVKAEGTMVAKSSFSIVPATYADGMIFVGLAGGKIQAFNAATLESLWVYTDDLGGQPNCPITYKDGYIYAGYWNSETKDANFVCVNTIDEDHDSTTEAKLASWTYTRAGGFYWAGAYVSDRLAIVGTDDGQSGSTSDSSSLLVFDRFTGELLDHRDGIHGDIRSNVSHDPDSDRIFFTSKGGVLCNARVDWSTGEITDFHQVVLQDANGTEYAMSTCTPSVYNGRIYIGVCGASQFGDNSGHAIAVYDLNADGSMTRAYGYAIVGYPQSSAMVTTAYADEEDGSVYIYLPYNAQPGGISVLKDKKGQTAPITTTDEGYSEIFTPVSPLNQYCICSTIADEYGTIYYKNDSCYMMAITSKIESLELVEEPTFNEAGKASGLKAVTHQKNGTTRDVTRYADVDYNAETGAYAVSYTYGLDHDNYGLKTLTVYSVALPQGEGFTFTGGTHANSWEPYTFTVTFDEGVNVEDYVVAVNGSQVTLDEQGQYTLETVTEAPVITVKKVSRVPEQDAEGTYLIENGYQLKWLADKVNGGEYVANAKLTQDIDMSVVCGPEVGSWVPMGNYEVNAYYQGTFDGQGHTISKFYINESDASVDGSTYYRGLFGQVQAGSVIKDVNLTGSITSSRRYVGGLVGKVGTLVAGDVTIENCHVNAAIKVNSNYAPVGGIAGQIRQGTIKNCSFSGTIETGYQTNAGGIVGAASVMPSTITGCLFNGSIKSTGSYNEKYGVGGILGNLENHATTTVTNCASVGTLQINGMTTGGIVGNLRGDNDLTVSNCYNAATINKTSAPVGGVLGQNNGSTEPTITNCFYLDTFATSETAGASAKSADELKRATVVILLGEGFKLSDGTVNGGYPGLSWQEYEAPALPEHYEVTLTQGTGYTLSGDPVAVKDDSYTVALDIELGYEKGESFAVKANDVAMTENKDGTFTITGVSGALTITVEGVVESVNPPVNITLTEGDGYTLTGEARVAYGVDYTFTLAIDEAYGKSDDFAVKANGETITGTRDGTYTIRALSEDVTITVEGLLPYYTVKVNTKAGYTLSAYTGYAAPSTTGVKLLSNQDYKFVVKPNEGYAVRDNNYAPSSGVNVNVIYEVVGDHAVVTVTYVKGDGTISFAGIKKFMNVTLPESEAFTITPADSYKDMVLLDETYSFTLQANEGYHLGENVAVKAGDTVLTANEQGVYSFKVTADTAITVTGVERDAIHISVYYADQGTIVTGKDGTLLNYADVEVTDANGDGKYTMYDGFYCFHEQYHTNGASGYEDNNWVSKFWSQETSMVSYGHNNRWVYSTEEEIVAGDSICLFTYQDQISWSDLFTYFDSLTATATANQEATFHVNGYSFFGSSATTDAVAAPVGATVTATSGETVLTTTVDEKGDFKLTFPVKGEYTVLVNGKCSYTCDAGYYAGQTYTDAPVAPAMMTVTVEGASYTITLPEMDGVETNPLKGYTTTVKEGETFKFYLGTAVGYEPGENYAVKANGDVLTGVNGTYTLENVTSDVTITVEDVKAIHWDPVTVYFSISHEDLFQTGPGSDEVMALRKISVPYFDLGLYGLEDFYFSSEYYGPSDTENPDPGPGSALNPGTPEYAYGKITLLHLYIYALEVYYCGLDESEAGKGYLYDQNLLGTEVLEVSGSAGSIFMNQFWGMDLNLNYYVNYEYPLASEGWGSTSDQILLREGDVITVGHFESWSFFNDSTSIFNYLTPDEDNQVYGTTTATQGDKVTLTGYHAGNGMGGNYTTGHYKITTEPAIYCTAYDDVSQDFGAWTELGNLSPDGTIEIDTADLTPGTYVVAMAGQYGLEITTDICSTPGGILLVVEESQEPGSDVVLGDVNGDGTINMLDMQLVYNAANGKTELTQEQTEAADVNGDDTITMRDMQIIYQYINGKLETFPAGK